MTKVVKEIQTKIDGLDVGDMIVTWDMSYTYDIPEDAHPDNPAPGTCETRDVEQVYNIELQLFNKVGIDLTEQVKGNYILFKRLCDELLIAVENYSISDLQHIEYDAV